jgi:hypothetical protein
MCMSCMLQLINDLPSHVIGIHAFADVSVKEYHETLIPQLDNLVIRKLPINLILVIETDTKEFSPGNWCVNIKTGMKYFFKWRKIAVVTDQKGMMGINDLFKYVIPGVHRLHSLDQIDKALIWIAEK